MQQILSLYDDAFDEHLNSISISNNARTEGTSYYGYKWTTSQVTVGIATSNAPASTYITSLRTGMTSWNASNPNCDMLYTGTAAGVVSVNFSTAELGMAGLTEVNYDSGVAWGATVTFYNNVLGNSTSRWQCCASHEFGHLLGMRSLYQY